MASLGGMLSLSPFSEPRESSCAPASSGCLSPSETLLSPYIRRTAQLYAGLEVQGLRPAHTSFHQVYGLTLNEPSSPQILWRTIHSTYRQS